MSVVYTAVNLMERPPCECGEHRERGFLYRDHSRHDPYTVQMDRSTHFHRPVSAHQGPTMLHEHDGMRRLQIGIRSITERDLSAIKREKKPRDGLTRTKLSMSAAS